MDRWNVYELLALRPDDEHTYEEVFRAHELSVGLSVWPEGRPDEQKPHAEDEVYYVIEGRGVIRVGEMTSPWSKDPSFMWPRTLSITFTRSRTNSRYSSSGLRLTIRANPSILHA